MHGHGHGPAENVTPGLFMFSLRTHPICVFVQAQPVGVLAHIGLHVVTFNVFHVLAENQLPEIKRRLSSANYSRTFI